MTVAGDFIALLPHPLAPCAAVDALDVQVRVAPDGALGLRYRLQGDLTRLRIPSPRPPARADGLWAHTCFELFVGPAGANLYREFNFSPSGEWAAYAFRAYREHDEDAAHVETTAAPRIVVHADARRLELDARVPAAALPSRRTLGGGLQLGLTAVIEDLDGLRSYWALRHPAARPDFHLREGFALTIGHAATAVRSPPQRTPATD